MDTGSKVINIVLPHSWADLTDQQLGFVFELLALNLGETDIKMHCLLKWCRKQLRTAQTADGFTLLAEEFPLLPWQLAELIRRLAWLDSLPALPVRTDRIGRSRAVDAMLQGVAFEKYLICDNLYQGFLETRDDSLLCQMAEVLYDPAPKCLTKANAVNVFYWFAALKQCLAARFPNFLRPVGAGAKPQNMMGQSLSKQLSDAMNAQIRALTKGDITKERDVLAMDTWRALAELDALAKESHEIDMKKR